MKKKNFFLLIYIFFKLFIFILIFKKGFHFTFGNYLFNLKLNFFFLIYCFQKYNIISKLRKNFQNHQLFL